VWRKFLQIATTALRFPIFSSRMKIVHAMLGYVMYVVRTTLLDFWRLLIEPYKTLQIGRGTQEWIPEFGGRNFLETDLLTVRWDWGLKLDLSRLWSCPKMSFSTGAVKTVTPIARNAIIFVTGMFLYCVICFRPSCSPSNNQ
jgi:hypothetical protein